jgi:hypothetical protein
MARVPAALVVLAALAACVDGGDEAVAILQNQAPQEGCVIPATPTSDYLGAGRIDVLSPVGYLFTPVARNYARPLSSAPLMRVAFVQGAQIEIRFARDEVFTASEQAALRDQGLTRFQTPFSAVIEPGGSTTSMAFEIVPRELIANHLADRLTPDASILLLVQVILFGDMGGSRFEAVPYQYSVEVCDGCVVEQVGACADLPSTYPVGTGGECNPFQDRRLTCCTSATGGLLCPAVSGA